MPLSEGFVQGRVIAITGTTNGIGQAAALELACMGATIVQLVRDDLKAQRLTKRIEREAGAGRAPHVACDLSSFASVRAAAQEVCERFPRIDVLINNAGIIATERTITEDGHELTWQVNHLSHFLLTNLLRPTLVAAAPSRVITVSSDAHFGAWSGVRFGDPDLERGWRPFRAYAQTKLANIMFAAELAERWAGSGVSSNAMHPGIVRSGFGREGYGPYDPRYDRLIPMLTPERGAETLVWLASSPEVEGTSGMYYYRKRLKRPSRTARDVHARRRLWRVSADATGLTADEDVSDIDHSPVPVLAAEDER